MDIATIEERQVYELLPPTVQVGAGIARDKINTSHHVTSPLGIIPSPPTPSTEASLHEAATASSSLALQLRAFLTELFPSGEDTTSMFDAKVRSKGLSLVEEKKMYVLIIPYHGPVSTASLPYVSLAL